MVEEGSAYEKRDWKKTKFQVKKKRAQFSFVSHI